MKKLIAALTGLLAAALLALAGTANAADVSQFCLNSSQTVTAPFSVSGGGVTVTVGSGIANAGTFSVGKDKTTGVARVVIAPVIAADVLQPGYATFTTTPGACVVSPPPVVVPPNNTMLIRLTWGCYSKSQVNPGAWPVEPSVLYSQGYWKPIAVKDAIGATRLGYGTYLICNAPTGYNPVAGKAASVGGGDVYGGTEVPSMFRDDPYGVTQLYSK